MKITLCGSNFFTKEMQELKAKLETLGHEVKMPLLTMRDKDNKEIPIQDFYNLRKAQVHHEAWVWERKQYAMKLHFDKVVWADAILVVNHDKNGIQGYVGPNTLLEMGLAMHLQKLIYLLKPIADTLYCREEILGMHPMVIHGDITLIK